MTLPPLPDPQYPAVYIGLGKQQRAGYTADQMRAYATAAVLAEREAICLALPGGAVICQTGAIGGAAGRWAASLPVADGDLHQIYTASPRITITGTDPRRHTRSSPLAGTVAASSSVD